MAENGRAPLELAYEIEQFFYAEADLLDERRFTEWLALFADDVRYWMPLVRNVRLGDDAREFTREQEDAAWIDEGKETLSQRVQQLLTGIHWAEEPRSRMSHVVTNIRILKVEPDYDNPKRVETRCRFVVYRNRLQDEVDIFVGKRNDTLSRADGDWKISRREILLDQSVLLAKNLTTFF
jgi:3-phenylpropionate/cinnamic acid dioxygenase small subunit